ncbi:hypothetical protein TIFTF001_032904 [Ficus carica]|uniref:Uncharacterized protein n=1 Tax=Ficus carica TaxID=3494 RepID=A0AA88J716_FICCA|nr:hypothetical protein TIFTF001_032904 [Ficus carica]
MLPGQSLPPHRGLPGTRVRLYPETTRLLCTEPIARGTMCVTRGGPLSQHSIHHLTSDVKPITAHINSQLPSPATTHITSPTSASCPDWGYAYWCRRRATVQDQLSPSNHIRCYAGDFRHQHFGARMRAPAFPATATSSHTLCECPTTTKSWMSELARTSKALTTRLLPVHRALDGPSIENARGAATIRPPTQATPTVTTRHDRKDTVNVSGSTTSVFDRLGGAGKSWQWIRDRSVEKSTKEEKDNQDRLDHLQRQLDQIMGQQFKMPSMASYDGSTDADEHLENYQAHMLIQNANEAALCESEPFKKFLDRFDKAVVQIKSCSDDTLIQVFREGVKDRRLVLPLTYDVPPTRHPGKKSDKNMAGPSRPEKGKAVNVEVRRAEASPGPRTLARRFCQYTPLVATVEHILNQVSGWGLLRDSPPHRTDRARRNQNKYYNFHKDVGHECNNPPSTGRYHTFIHT